MAEEKNRLPDPESMISKQENRKKRKTEMFVFLNNEIMWYLLLSQYTVEHHAEACEYIHFNGPHTIHSIIMLNLFIKISHIWNCLSLVRY